MTDYKPGTVAIATVCGEPNVRVFRVATSEFDRDNWRSERIVNRSVLHEDDRHEDDCVTDIRPLVVIDPEDYIAVREVVQHSNYMAPGELVGPLVSAIMQGLQAVAPRGRISEPGLWGVVATGYADGSSVDYWTHGPGGWFGENGQLREWGDLEDPVLIRPGI